MMAFTICFTIFWCILFAATVAVAITDLIMGIKFYFKEKRK